MNLDRDLLLEVAATCIERQTILFLASDAKKADHLAGLLRSVIVEEAAKILDEDPKDTKRVLLKKEGFNPSFVALHRGGWCFFYEISDVGADDDIGQPVWVYWPTRELDYEKIHYAVWQKARRQGIIWRVEPKEVAKEAEPMTAWDHLLAED